MPGKHIVTATASAARPRPLRSVSTTPCHTISETYCVRCLIVMVCCAVEVQHWWLRRLVCRGALATQRLVTDRETELSACNSVWANVYSDLRCLSQTSYRTVIFPSTLPCSLLLCTAPSTSQPPARPSAGCPLSVL